MLSRTTAHVDLGPKRLGYHRAGVTHYWLLDPHNETLTVLQWTAQGYLVELVAGRGDKGRAPPFDAIDVEVSELLDDAEESAGEDAEVGDVTDAALLATLVEGCDAIIHLAALIGIP